MNYLLGMLKSRLPLVFLGVVSVALSIWYIGPLISIADFAPLVSQFNRVIAIAVIVTIWLLSTIWKFFKARQKNRHLLDSLADQAPMSANEEATAEELAELKRKMQGAIDTLKQRNFSAKGGKRFLYELPWYAIIGPPGAGKTTLLSNSGLNFPLENTHGKHSVKGVGGTRNCDWWFTDQAVLLDTAGRYATQDSEADVDRSAWTSFLKMLMEVRKRRPLNGVLVAISMQDLLDNDVDTLAQTAKLLRTRIEELYTQLDISPPIYLLITKCDLIAGFNEYFAQMNGDERKQVWGFTLPLESSDSQESLISLELNSLGEEIANQTIARMHRELSQKNREDIYTFPMQFSLAQERVDSFVRHLTIQSSLLNDIMFRGAYFTSATQTGSAIDKVIANVSASFGVNRELQKANTHSGKSYFINKLLKDVIFEESGLAGTNIKSERRQKFMQLGIGALIPLLLLAVLGLWTFSYVKNKNALQRIEHLTVSLQTGTSELQPESIDIIATDDVLNDARKLAFGEDKQSADENGFAIKHAGLYQGDLVNDAATKTYRELLIDILLPRLMVRLEHQMHAESTNNEFLFEALKTYQMIGDRRHFVSDEVIGWFNYDMDINLPPDTTPERRNSLKAHIASLFEIHPYRLPRVTDRGLVEQYQQIASGVSLQERAYNRMKAANGDVVTAYFKLSDIGGAQIALMFERNDSIMIDKSIPLFFTPTEYRETFLPANKDISQSLAADAWVLGSYADTDDSQLDSQALQKSVTDQYFDEYIKTWESLISNIRLKPVDNLDAAAEFISQLGETQSPLKSLLVIVGEQTKLTLPLVPAAEDAELPAPVDRTKQLIALLGGEKQRTVDSTTTDPVTAHFSELHDTIKNWEDGKSRLDDILAQLSELNIQLLPMAKNTGGSMDPKLNSDLSVGLQKLSTSASRMPEPLASLVQDISTDVGDVASGGFCQQLNNAWKADVYRYYQRTIRNRYPVNRRGTADIATVDFGKFFGQDGVIDQFVNKYLEAHVSKTANQWTWTGTSSVQCLSNNSLKQLAFAEDIRNTFFSTGGQTPSFRFDVLPGQIVVSSLIEQFVLNVGGSSMEFFHGPIKGSTSFQWPDPTNNNQVALRVLPALPGTNSSISMSGPWAILRLFEQGRRESSSGTLKVDYSFGGRAASLTLATSSFNPLNSVALRNFRLSENL